MFIDPLAMMQAANAKSKQRRQRGASAITAALEQGPINSAASAPNVSALGMSPGKPTNMRMSPDSMGKWGHPLAGKLHVNEDYGPRTHPVTGKKGFHTGEDLRATAGTPVYAVGDGVVNKAGNGGAYGNQVVLGLGGGLASMYGHLSKFAVKPGQRVRKGQVIGYVGSTGLSTGPHLHYEVWKNGQPVNPGGYL